MGEYDGNSQFISFKIFLSSVHNSIFVKEFSEKATNASAKTVHPWYLHAIQIEAAAIT